MIQPTFSPERSELIRAELQRIVEDTPVHRIRRRRRRWTGLASFIAVGAVAGGALTAAAASGLLWPHTEPNPLPGAPVAQGLSEPILREGIGDATLALPIEPIGTTDLSVIFTCESAGEFGWGTVRGHTPSITCAPGEKSSFTFPVTADPTTLYVTAAEDAGWSVALRYVQIKNQPLGHNANGETFGVSGSGPADGTGLNEPDLVAVMGVTDAGDYVQGFARAADLAQPQPSSPEEALAFNDEWARLYPNGKQVPVYESDGVTRIGTFTSG